MGIPEWRTRRSRSPPGPGRAEGRSQSKQGANQEASKDYYVSEDKAVDH